MDENATLGQRLREARKKRGWSQKYVSEKTKIPSANISNYERDVRKPDYTSLVKLAQLYGESIDYLIAGKRSHERPSGVFSIHSVPTVIRGHFTSLQDTTRTEEMALIPIRRVLLSNSVEGYIPMFTRELDLENYDYFWFVAQDDAMSGDNIHEGTLALIRISNDDEKKNYTNGSIRLVVNIKAGTHELRRVFEYDDIIVVQASHPNYPPRTLRKNTLIKWDSGYGLGEVIRIMQVYEPRVMKTDQ